MRRFQHRSVVAARCFAAVAPPPVVVSGEGVDQIGREARTKLGDGVAASLVAGEGAIDPLWLPPMLRGGWEGDDRAGAKRLAKLDNGVAAPLVAGEGAIDLSGLPPMLRCGWEGVVAGTLIFFRSQNAAYPRLP
jgi:hypothetical protein